MRELGGRKGEAQDEAGYIHMISVDMDPITLERILSKEKLARSVRERSIQPRSLRDGRI